MNRVWVPVVVCIIAVTTLLSCGPRGEVSSPAGTPGAAPVGSQQNAAFNRGFHKEEVTPTANLRWAHQDSGFTVTVPAAGNYRLGFKTVTVFSPTPTAIEVSVNGQSVGTITAEGFDFAKAPVSNVEAALRAGANEIALKANRADVPLGANDTRTAAFGLILPVGVELLP